MTAKKTGHRTDAEHESPTPAGEVFSAKVTLCGESFQLRTDQAPEVVKRLAAYIDAKVREAGGSTGTPPGNFRVLGLATLGITGELFENKAKLEEQEKASRNMLAKARSLTESLDRALAARD